ncbi:MAG TPA: prepilin-type N-terminal cleavage/methylation domain-containing protein [Chthoniobacterales bacterium]|nr:prepilin-type N-terminal cleavage/methylation domain-containing protein [Chthoniobacterales bacterium]
MNPPSPRAPAFARAFTLIELIVVILIIAVLIGLAFPAFRGLQNQTKRAQARNDLAQIVTAVNAFYTEYGKYPLATADTIYGPAATSNAPLFNELRATAAQTQNPRQIVFISPPDAKDPARPRSGIGTSTGAGQFFDPWGVAYHVEIDGNYNNQIDANPYSTNAGSNPLRAGVIAWSFGKDGQSQSTSTPSDKNTGTNKDDVISWQ